MASNYWSILGLNKPSALIASERLTAMLRTIAVLGFCAAATLLVVFLIVLAGNLTGTVQDTTTGGIAQLRLVPAEESQLPKKGKIGDLWMHRHLSAATTAVVHLYLCVNDSPVQWQQVQVALQIFSGGSNVP